MDFSPDRARRLLCHLQDGVRERVSEAVGRGTVRMSRVSGVTAADTIYAVDRVSEGAVLSWFEENWPRRWPVELVMEGLSGAGSRQFPEGTSVGQTKFKLILDPIDGTRGLMYDKRSAWSLAGLALQRGAKTHLGDIIVAAMTELPTSKQAQADQLSAVRGRGVHAERIDLRTWRRRRFVPRPSRARDVIHGFASFAKFFPEGKSWLAGIEEEMWTELCACEGTAGLPVFDDQYLSTGGQVYELLAGHDRFVADLRPIALRQLKLESGLCCHPYDICTALIAEEAGCLLETPEGRPLHPPLDTTSAVAWTGYANPALGRSIRPVLRKLLRRRSAL